MSCSPDNKHDIRSDITKSWKILTFSKSKTTLTLRNFFQSRFWKVERWAAQRNYFQLDFDFEKVKSPDLLTGWSPKIHKRLFTQTQIFGLGRPILKRPPKIPIWQKCNSNKICTISKSIDTKEHCYIISIQLNHYIMFKNQQNCA